MRPPIDSALPAGRRHEAADQTARLPGLAPGLIIPSKVPIAVRIGALLATVANQDMGARSRAIDHIRHLAGQAIDAADFEDETYQAVLDAEEALVRAWPIGINGPLRPDIERALDALRAYAREVEP